jgi:hypothetical protein
MYTNAPHLKVCVIASALAGLLTACQGLPQSEYKDFKPMSQERRVIKQVKLTWDVRPDAELFCASQLKGKLKAVSGTPVACAVWRAETSECLIVTGPNPNHMVLGHELRHCFEGNFH